MSFSCELAASSSSSHGASSAVSDFSCRSSSDSESAVTCEVTVVVRVEALVSGLGLTEVTRLPRVVRETLLIEVDDEVVGC